MRKLVGIAIALSTSTSACRTSFDFVPTSQADLRVGISEAEREGGRATLRDQRGGTISIDGATPVRVRDHANPPAARPEEGMSVDARTTELGVSRLVLLCGPSGKRCPIDAPQSTFEVGRSKQVFAPEIAAEYVLGGLFTVGLVYGNVACLSKEGCSTPVAVTVGIVDGLILLGGALAVVASGAWSKRMTMRYPYPSRVASGW